MIQNYVDKVIVYKDHVEVSLDFRGFFIFSEIIVKQ